MVNDIIFPIELEIKDTTEAKVCLYLDLYLEIDNKSELRTKLYDFDCPTNFPFMSSIIPAELAYGVPSWYNTAGLALFMWTLFTEGCWWQESLWAKVFQGKIKVITWDFFSRHHDEHRLTGTKYPFHQFVPMQVVNNIDCNYTPAFLLSNRRWSLVEQGWFTLSNMKSPLFL